MRETDIYPGLQECYIEGCVRKHCPKCGGHVRRVNSERGKFFCDFCGEYFEKEEVE